VRYFAVLRERVRCDGEVLDLADGATVRAALDVLAARHPAVAALRGRFRAAVNQDMVGDDAPLREGDELALIPPVAGGAPADAAARLARMVHDRAPSLDIVVDAVRSPDAGAIATFTGLVRRHNQGRAVERLEYEAYDAMANKVMSELCDAIEAEMAGVRVAVEHRAGALVVGDVAVAIAASAPHRAEAFAACRAMIERLKEKAPIWKKEIGPDGAEWIGLGP